MTGVVAGAHETATTKGRTGVLSDSRALLY